MKTKKIVPALLLATMPIAALFLTSCNTGDQGSSYSGPSPNIILIVADDMGYAEAGCYGQQIIQTPAIDRMAAEGMKFTAFYSGSPVCAPSRCVLMTGQHTGHSYIRNNGEPVKSLRGSPFPGQNPLPDSILTLAEILKDQGYATACIGKWGLGHTNNSGNPANQGFDFFYGYKCQRHAHNHYPEFLWRNDSMEVLEGNDRSLYGEQHSQDLFAVEALNFIRNNEDQPFFLYLPFIIPHLSIQTTDTFLSIYRESVPEHEYEHRGYIQHPYPHAGYAGMIHQMDHAIGLVMDEIDKLGLAENTIFLFTSDNGPTFDRLGGADSDFFNSSGPFRGRKGSLLEGGIRVPLVAKWEGEIEEGSHSSMQAAFWDILPTLCDLTGADIPENTDGISFLPTLMASGKQEVHKSLYWEFPSYGGQAALIRGNYKLLLTGLKAKDKPILVQLYNLEDDPGETEDLTYAHPRIVAKMIREMKRSRTPSELFAFEELASLLASYP